MDWIGSKGSSDINNNSYLNPQNLQAQLIISNVYALDFPFIKFPPQSCKAQSP